MAKNKWNEGDLINLTRDCEIGKRGETLHVIATAGHYMTARTLIEPRRWERTGRDYAFAVKVGTLAVDPNDAEAACIPAGSYRLDADLENPSPDRRMTRDWTKLPVWLKGTEFVVRDQVRMTKAHLEESVADLPKHVADRLREHNTYTVVEMVGERYPGLHRVGPGNVLQYAALGASLVRTEESVDQFMTRIDCGDRFVAWLVEVGAIKRDELERLWNRYQYGWTGEGGDDATTLDEPVGGEG